jgi:hypothetical protein
MKRVLAWLKTFCLKDKIPGRAEFELDRQLRDAIRSCDVDAVRSALSAGARPHGSCVLDQDGFHTPFELAVRVGCPDVIHSLRENT